jgi:hypothetical protein
MPFQQNAGQGQQWEARPFRQDFAPQGFFQPGSNHGNFQAQS